MLRTTNKINGISQNKIKVSLNGSSITTLGNKEICEKNHHLDFIVVRKHLLSLTLLPSNLAAQKPWASSGPWMQWGNVQLFVTLSYPEGWYVVKKISDVECVMRSNSVKMMKPGPTAISSYSPAQPIYILSIYIQMETACLVMEIGIQTHIMPPHHFVEVYPTVFRIDSFHFGPLIYIVDQTKSMEVSCLNYIKCFVQKANMISGSLTPCKICYSEH